MGPSFERAIKISILPKDLDNLSELSNQEKECLFCNCCVIDLLFENIDKELLDSIQDEKKFQKICLDASRLWQFFEAICEDDYDNEGQEEEEESLEEYNSAETCTLLVTPPEDQEAKERKSAGSLLEPVRPI